jgi:hypothetical protein
MKSKKMDIFSYKMLYLKHLKIGLISILAHFDGLYEEMSEFKFPASFESCRAAESNIAP